MHHRNTEDTEIAENIAETSHLRVGEGQPGGQSDFVVASRVAGRVGLAPPSVSLREGSRARESVGRDARWGRFASYGVPERRPSDPP